MSKNYDLVILGGGMGGYVSAIRARQLGMTVALVEAEKLGGTCLHKGCIPTKALLKSAEIYQTLKNSSNYGVYADNISFDFSKVQSNKEETVTALYEGVQQLMKKHQVDIYQGYGRLLGPSIFSPQPGTVSVEIKDSENQMLIGESVLLATGAKPKALPNLPFDGKVVLSSDDLLTIEALPKEIVIIGGGVIGCEWASMLLDYGVNVTLVEQANQLLPNFDHSIQQTLKQALVKRGCRIYTGAAMEAFEVTEQQFKTTLITDEETKSLQAEVVLVSIGRQPNTIGIGLENTAIEQDQQGFIQVDENFRTKEKHIYAVGDCIGGLQLAHVAAHEGKYCVETIAGEHPFAESLANVSSCVYSEPEIATVGLTEKEAKDAFAKVKVISVPFRANGKAKIEGKEDGFIKIVMNEDTDDLLGVHMIGAKVTEMIAEAGLAMLVNASIEEIGATIHPHPSLTEAIEEAALGLKGKIIHG